MGPHTTTSITFSTYRTNQTTPSLPLPARPSRHSSLPPSLPPSLLMLDLLPLVPLVHHHDLAALLKVPFHQTPPTTSATPLLLLLGLSPPGSTLLCPFKGHCYCWARTEHSSVLQEAETDRHVVLLFSHCLEEDPSPHLDEDPSPFTPPCPQQQSPSRLTGPHSPSPARTQLSKESVNCISSVS
jgi:hypothetical protein